MNMAIGYFLVILSRRIWPAPENWSMGDVRISLYGILTFQMLLNTGAGHTELDYLGGRIDVFQGDGVLDSDIGQRQFEPQGGIQPAIRIPKLLDGLRHGATEKRRSHSLLGLKGEEPGGICV